MSARSKVGWRVWLALIVLCGVLLRLYDVSAPLYLGSHSWRQADSAAFTDGYLQHGLNLFSPRIAKQPCQYFSEPFGAVESELPVIAWLAALPLAATGQQWAPPWYLRSVSVLLYAFTCLLLFALVRRFSGEDSAQGRHTEGLVAVGAFSLFPICAYFTRSPQPDGPALLFIVAFLFYLDRWLQERRHLDGVLSTLACSTALLLKASNGYILPVGLYLVLRRRKPAQVIKDWRMWLFALASLGPALAWYRYAHVAHAHSFDIWTFRKFTQWDDYLKLEHWKWFGLRFSIPVLTVFGCVLSVVGLVGGKAPGLARAWFAGCVLFLLLAIKANRTHVYYQLIYVLPAALACAQAVMLLMRSGVVAKTLLATFVIGHLVIGYNVLWDRDDPGELWGYYQTRAPAVSEAVPLLQDNLPESERFVSTLDHPALFVGAKRMGYIATLAESSSVMKCMKKGVQYALVPRSWSKPTGVRVIARTRSFSIWHRVPVETWGNKGG